MSFLKDKVVIVTGATRGIGRTILEAFSQEGAKLAICSRNESQLKAEVDVILGRTKDLEIFYSKCDVSDYGEVKRFVSQVMKFFGKIDILVNNAGIGIFDEIESYQVQDWNELINVNLNGCFYLCREVIPIMKKNNELPRGYIFNIGSLSPNLLVEHSAAYSCSKAALREFSEHLFHELREHEVFVSYLAPGSVDTDFSPRNREAGWRWKIKSDDIASLVLQMASSVYAGMSCCVTYAEIRVMHPIITNCYKE